MPDPNHRSVTVPKDVVDEMEKWLQENRDGLKKIGIKKISHVVERSWYQFKENNPLNSKNP